MIKNITKWFAIIGGGGVVISLILICLYVILFVNVGVGLFMMFGLMLVLGVFGFILNEIIQDLGLFKK